MNFANIAAQAAFQADQRREHDIARAQAISELAAELQEPGGLCDPTDAAHVVEAFVDDLPTTTNEALSAALRRGDCFAVGALVIAHVQAYCAMSAELLAEHRIDSPEAA